ncbi:uncharacterized protein EURHEDRAFT_19559 [Aspergillus ruber CBS 135680]|uniref:Uncharacterized protein n=1 Tax=Aspergillus ruber (strain CBS 135680) TaxID=1388766 RepID=A0A017SRF5_ASPRC|nr:uncharacterized protein EURHEDRAFT_19559 [Aspergillus ruber CBS 135680]EYE99527.1 hypothetical protein EURHEDRAFT_19559 [Aspergillus ruber CBS 135680]
MRVKKGSGVYIATMKSHEIIRRLRRIIQGVPRRLLLSVNFFSQFKIPSCCCSMHHLHHLGTHFRFLIRCSCCAPSMNTLRVSQRDKAMSVQEMLFSTYLFAAIRLRCIAFTDLFAMAFLLLYTAEEMVRLTAEGMLWRT